MNYAKIGATSFILWGLLHIVGGSAILLAVTESPEAGFAMYNAPAAPYTALAGSVLGYLAYGFVWIAVVVTYVGVRYNWRNSQQGLALNTALVGLTDIGLIVFLVLPGFLSWGEASPGLLLFASGAIAGGIGCTMAESGPQGVAGETT
jgi:hypothetical protein